LEEQLTHPASVAEKKIAMVSGSAVVGKVLYHFQNDAYVDSQVKILMIDLERELQKTDVSKDVVEDMLTMLDHAKTLLQNAQKIS